AILRMSVNSFVDNIAMGNIAAPIDLETGRLMSEGVYKDITKPPVATHPVTGKQIVGFQVPHWQAVLEMTKRAALHDR
ncbi:sugar-transfer associated ATP-grasp domain-containing protein, partial [Klebsiella pneumoniae]|uniref:sugar-transfer associated ATP-grasp domain-containing protein n=1 Tax=Klebsiella pneumoniae TaxID=573 RepID=UPI0027306FBD